MKLIYLSERVMYARCIADYAIERMKEKGFEVEIWSLINLNYSNITQNAEKREGMAGFEVAQRKFRNKKEVTDAIKQLEPSQCYIIALFGYELKHYFIYRALARRKIRYCMISSDVTPGSTNTIQTKQNTFLGRLKRLTLKKIANLCFRKISPQLLGVSAANKIFYGGKKSITPNRLKDHNTTSVMIHSLDYNKCRNIEKSKNDFPEKFILFLDSNNIMSPDYYYDDTLKCPYTAENYYRSLNRFFAFLEKQLNIPVVIALHPTSDIQSNIINYQNRVVVKGRTPELVNQCDLVVTQDSMAVSFAVILQKPVTFVTTDEMLSSSVFSNNINSLTKSFGKKAINIDHFSTDINIADFFTINESCYQDYKENYIKQAGSKDQDFWDVFAAAVSS